MADHAVRARSFGAVAEEYDRGRPGYPSEAVAWALGSEPLDVVDLGAGTGKLTATLVQTGHRVVAVEPDPEMRALLERDLPSVRVAAADAEATGLPAASADAVVAGAAFHWFDRSRVFPEIARLLRPPGVLALFGNSFADDSDWAERFRKLGHGAAPGRAGRWPEADELSTYFQAVEDARFAHTHHVTRAGLRDLVLSRSQIATLPLDERERVLTEVDEWWDTEPSLRGSEQVGLEYSTRVRRASGSRPRR